MVYIKQKRKFNDAWAFILYVILSIGCNSYLALQVSKGKYEGFGKKNYPFMLVSLFVTLFFISCNYVGLSFFTEAYLKLTVLSFPLILIAMCVLAKFAASCIISSLIAIVLWGIFMYFCWSRIPTVAKILNHAMKALSSNFFSCIFGILLCTITQVVQMFLLFGIEVDSNSTLALLTILIVFNTYWSIANFIYFFKVYISGIVAFHFIEHGNNSESVFQKSIVNSMYALGSISFAGLLIAVVQTLQYIINAVEERDERGRRRERNLFSVILLCLATCILSLLEDILRFTNELTMPYVAIHGEGYVKSVKESYKLLGKNNSFILIALNVLNYSLILSAVGFFSSLLCVTFFFFDLGNVKSMEISTFIQIFSVLYVLVVLYSTFMMVFASSLLALTYLYIENPEVVDSVDPSIKESFQRCKEIS